MKIAIIGSGISGLTAAHLLHSDHEIEVFEGGDHIGGHANTVEVEWQGERHAIDTGFIVYNDQNYPLFSSMLAEHGVATQPTTMSFSVQCERTGLEYRGADLWGLFAQRRNLVNPRFWRLLLDLLRFNRSAEQWLQGESLEMSVGEFFQRHRFDRGFLEQFFLPMASAIWSCPMSSIWDFPIRFVVEFYRHHGLLGIRSRPQWRVVCGGSQRYVERLVAPWRHRIRLRTAIAAVRRTADGVLVKPRLGEARRFDHVIMACHSDQALKLLGERSTPQEREILAAFPYEANQVLLHTDATVLPKQRRAWASWNYRVPERLDGKPMVTYDMNRLQGIESQHRFCVTLNDQGTVREEFILRSLTYHHPVFNVRRGAAQARHSELIDHDSVSYCGAYWGNGFHEDGVRSAYTMIEKLREGLCKVASTEGGCGIHETNRSSTAFAAASA